MSCGIYKITNLVNGKVYIGQSINIERRWEKHKTSNDDFAIHQAIKKYGLSNFTCEIIEECNQDELNEKEIYWINQYDSIKNGYNMIPGGSNGAGFAKGKEVQQFTMDGQFIATYSSALQAAEKTGLSHTNICACCREELFHVGGFQWKYTSSNKEIRPLNNPKNLQRSIIQYTLNGSFIREYDSLAEASKFTNIHKSSISNVCNGKSHTAGGYRWAYKDKQLIMDKPHQQPKLRKQVVQLDKNTGDIIQVYESLTEAHLATQINLANIGQVCNGKRQTAGGFKWKYKEDKEKD